jgi:hypothetical protein
MVFPEFIVRAMREEIKILAAEKNISMFILKNHKTKRAQGPLLTFFTV